MNNLSTQMKYTNPRERKHKSQLLKYRQMIAFSFFYFKQKLFVLTKKKKFQMDLFSE